MPFLTGAHLLLRAIYACASFVLRAFRDSVCGWSWVRLWLTPVRVLLYATRRAELSRRRHTTLPSDSRPTAVDSGLSLIQIIVSSGECECRGQM